MNVLRAPLPAFQAAGAVPTLIRGSKTFTGAANLGAQGAAPIFTVSGAVAVWGWWERCTTDLVGAGSITAGTASIASGLTIATPDATAIDAGKWNSGAGTWTASTGKNTASALWGDDFPVAFSESFIWTIGAADITGGVLEAYCLYIPLSPGASLSLGTGMTAL